MFNESLNEIYTFDATSFIFKDVNKAAQHNLGYSLDELQKMTPLDIKPHLNQSEFVKIIEPLLNDNAGKIKFETTHLRKDGSTYPVEVHLQLSNTGQNQNFVAMILDITEQKNYTENLERTVQKRTLQLTEALENEKELNELKTRFLSLVSHEFKTPLSSILTSITLLGKYKLTEQQENVINT
ncbi:PAS domain S-box protein [Zobellia nedashkovskayae]